MEKHINEITGLLDEARSDIYPAWAKSEIRIKIDALEKHLKDTNHHNNDVAHKIETARVYLDKLFKTPVRVDKETNIIFNEVCGSLNDVKTIKISA